MSTEQPEHAAAGKVKAVTWHEVACVCGVRFADETKEGAKAMLSRHLGNKEREARR